MEEKQPNSNVSTGLVMLHLRKIQDAEKKGGEATAALRNARKAAKADGIDLEMLEVMRKFDKMTESDLAEYLNAMITYAQHFSIPHLSQMDLFDSPEIDESVAMDLAYSRGLRAGKLGRDQTSNPAEPGTPAGQKWLEGWHDAQKLIMDAMGQGPEAAAKVAADAKRAAKGH